MSKSENLVKIFEDAKEAGHELTKRIVDHAVAVNPDNYTGMVFEYSNDAGIRGEVMITVQFLDTGKSPHDLRMEAEAREAAVREDLAALKVLLNNPRKPIGYVRTKELEDFLADGCSHNSLGLDHPSIWEEDAPYEWLEPLYRADPVLTPEEERREFEKAFPLGSGVFWREELNSYAVWVDSKESPHWGNYSLAFDANMRFEVWNARSKL